MLYFNRVLNAWLQGLKAGINKSLKFSDGIASIVRREHNQHNNDHTSNGKSQLDKMTAMLNRFEKKIARTGGGGGNDNRTPTGSGGGSSTKEMRKQPHRGYVQAALHQLPRREKLRVEGHRRRKVHLHA